MSDAPVLVMAGGTGGHIFTGIAVARELVSRGVPVVWLGSSHGLENELVPRAGFPLETIEVAGIRGKGWRTLLAAPFRIARDDHLAHGRDAIALEEHVFGSAEPNAFGAECPSDTGVTGRVGIGSHT
jgi:hypothetical protein